MLCLGLNLEKLFGLTYIHLYPLHVVATYGISRPAMYGRYRVYPPSGCGCGTSTQLIPHLVGQLLLCYSLYKSNDIVCDLLYSSESRLS